MSITEWRASLTPRQNYTPIQSIPHLLMQERLASEKDILSETFKNISFLLDSRETVSLSDALRFGSSSLLLQSEIIGGIREREIAVCEFFDKQDKLLHVSGLFFSFPKMNYMLLRHSVRASVPGSALRFLILRNNSTGCQTKHCILRPKQSHSNQPHG